MPYLSRSIESIRAQTFKDWEFVILDNGSNDGSVDVVREISRRDDRLRLEVRPRPLGLAQSSNEAVVLSRAPLVARMDSDDIAHPQRLERQLAMFRKFPAAVLVGALNHGIDAAGKRVRPHDRASLLRNGVFVPFPHGTAMFRRDAFRQTGGYRAATNGWEELDLFIRMSECGPVLVLVNDLYGMRYHQASSTSKATFERQATIAEIRRRCLEKYQRRESYAHVLEADKAPIEASRTSQAEAYAYQAARQVWSGFRPAPMPRLTGPLTKGSLKMQLKAATYWLFGSISPAFFRTALANTIRLRDALAGIRLGRKEVVEWRFGR
jgi:glycosyltransferase involved in cell wall biosynthesis